MHIAAHVLGHSVADTLYLVPFLYITYLAMEWLEHKTGERTRRAVRRAGVAGPAAGAVLGAVPQCGFSAAAATLWAGRVVTLGTLFAVFLSTSDEMLPIFIAEQVNPATIVKILGAKMAVGMVMGFAIDAVCRIVRRRAAKRASSLSACGSFDDRHAYDRTYDRTRDHTRDHAHDHAHDHTHDHSMKTLFKSALVHTAQVTVYIFIITCVLNVVLETVGEDALAAFLAQSPELSVLGAALVGLVPNCAASVVVAQLYVDGVLGSGAMFAGLLTAAGVGLLVLARANRHWKQNLAVIAALYATGALCGLFVNACGIAF